MINRLLRHPQRRIHLLAGGIGVLLVVLLAVLFYQPSEEKLALKRVEELMAAVESRDAETIAGTLDKNIAVVFMDQPEIMTREMVMDQARAIISDHPYINIRPVRSSTIVKPGNHEAKVDVYYHWTVTNVYYPNMRSRSEDLTKNGRPQHASITLVKENGRWVINVIELSLDVDQ